jgi:hypothetical protein
VFEYKPTELIEENNRTLLKNRLNKFEYESVNVFLEWSTFDNNIIHRPPYKLYLVIEPRDSSLKRVLVTGIEVKSDLQTYEVQDSWPVEMSIEYGKRTSHLFEPAFLFNFRDNENVRTKIDFEFISKNGIMKESLVTKWAPISVTHVAPIL